MGILSRKIATFLKKVADLPDRPGGTITTAVLKAQFDSSPEELRVAHNGLVDDLSSATAGTSGASQIGSETIAGVAGNDVFTQIKDVKSQLSNVVLNQIPNASITPAKLTFDPVESTEYTPADVLAKLLTVDGPASGLDAATVAGWKFQLSGGAVQYNDGTGWNNMGGVKSVQKGKTAVNASNTAPVTVDVTIASVNVAKSVVILPWAFNQQSSTNNTANFDAELVSATTLRFNAGQSAASTGVTIAWQVVEYY